MTRSHNRCRPTAEAVMVSKCANPACLAPFRYLHEGRIFTVRGHGADLNVERYWLCSSCSESMTLVLKNGRVALRSLAARPEAGIKPVQGIGRVSRDVA